MAPIPAHGSERRQHTYHVSFKEGRWANITIMHSVTTPLLPS
jgi:hypothetical protein